VTKVVLGAWGDHSNALGWGHLAACAAWDVEFTDAQIESLPFDLLSWYQVQPRGLWLLDQADIDLTKCLLHLDTNFADSVVPSRSFTAYGGTAAAISTAESKFGGGSLKLNGTNSRIMCPDSEDFNFGAGDWTVDFWVRFYVLPPSPLALIGQYDGGTNQRSWVISLGPGTMDLLWSNNGAGANSLTGPPAWSPVVNTWYHIAYCRQGANLYIFQDGVLKGTNTTLSGVTLWNSTATFAVGGSSAGGENNQAYLEEVRVTKGLARWTSNFTPPTAPYAVPSVLAVPDISGGGANETSRNGTVQSVNSVPLFVEGGTPQVFA
jgi:hypothetical protein